MLGSREARGKRLKGGKEVIQGKPIIPIYFGFIEILIWLFVYIADFNLVSLRQS
jgi:hypothetical protein